MDNYTKERGNYTKCFHNLFPSEEHSIPFGNWMVLMVLELGLSKKYQLLGWPTLKPFLENHAVEQMRVI
jgi:hypothetical protein